MRGLAGAKAFKAALSMASSKKKWMSSWAGAAVTSSPTSTHDCVEAVQHAIAVGGAKGKSLQLQGGWHSEYHVTEMEVATFLIARGDSAKIVLPPYDRPMLASPFKLTGVDIDADPGEPRGPATQNGMKFTRSFAHADVALDCAAFTASVIFK